MSNTTGCRAPWLIPMCGPGRARVGIDVISNGEQRDAVTRTVTCRSIAVTGITSKSSGELHRASLHTDRIPPVSMSHSIRARATQRKREHCNAHGASVSAIAPFPAKNDR
ncbi:MULTISPECIES: hypothetical protein [unclassified Burkholderia]|uniref:hypothetical protein n=1 Tax=unclassified Burkholderia TaxID=2613784 RepID=UPI000F55C4ED|nr:MULTISPECIES: hypothetical protein [unclassified Burkholderia]